MPRKKPKTQTNEDRERGLAIKRDKMKLLCEQRKLQSNNEELTFDEEQEPLVQRKKEEKLERQRERMGLLRSRRQLNCEVTPSSNVGVISSSHVEETLISTSNNVHTPSCHVEGTTSTYQVGDIPLFYMIAKAHHLWLKVRKMLNFMLMFKMLRKWKRL